MSDTIYTEGMKAYRDKVRGVTIPDMIQKALRDTFTITISDIEIVVSFNEAQQVSRLNIQYDTCQETYPISDMKRLMEQGIYEHK